MPLAEYQGPPNHTGMLRYLVGETIKACLIDAQGHVWIIMPSGFAIVFAGFDPMAPAFTVEPPLRVQQEVDRRRAELQIRIQDLKYLAPGIDL